MYYVNLEMNLVYDDMMISRSVYVIDANLEMITRTYVNLVQYNDIMI